MQLAIRKAMQTFIVAEVEYCYNFISRCVLLLQPARRAKESGCFRIGAHVLDHLLEAVAEAFHAWREHSERLITSDAEVEDYDLFSGGFVAEATVGVWDLRAVLFMDHVVHVAVAGYVECHQ